MTKLTHDELDILEGIVLTDVRRLREKWPDHRGFQQRADDLEKLARKLHQMREECGE